MKSEDLSFEIDFYEKLLKEKPDFVEAMIPLADAYTKTGRYQEGLALDRRLVKLCGDDPLAHYNLACSLALTGETKNAVESLCRSIRLGYRDLVHLLRDQDLKSLHGSPEFEALIKNFPEEKS